MISNISWKVRIMSFHNIAVVGLVHPLTLTSEELIYRRVNKICYFIWSLHTYSSLDHF